MKRPAAAVESNKEDADPSGSAGPSKRPAAAVEEDEGPSGSAGPSVAQRKMDRAAEHMERKRMRLADDRSCLVQLLQTCRATAATAPDQRQAELFHPGQSVLQWWAPWMQACEEGKMPKTYNKKSRPTWFSGEVLGKAGWMNHLYAGRMYEGYCYDAY